MWADKTNLHRTGPRTVVFGLALVVLMGFSFSGFLRADDSSPLPAKDETRVMGWLEAVYLKPWGLRVTAKLDTGAKTSSVHASQVEHFTKDGKDWVRFSFIQDEEKKKTLIERPLIRTAVIKERLAKSSTRDVVTLVVCKNGREYETEFTLNDRSNFNYPLLLGRSFLENVALVDASETFLFKADTDTCAARSTENHSGAGR